MAGSSKCMGLDNEEIWKEEFSAISKSKFSDDSDMVVKFLSGSKQSKERKTKKEVVGRRRG
jgi:hypothetical protein